MPVHTTDLSNRMHRGGSLQSIFSELPGDLDNHKHLVMAK